MTLNKLYIFVIFFFIINPLFAQHTGRASSWFVRNITIPHAQDSVMLDSMSLQPSSLLIKNQGRTLDSSQYHYDYNTHYLHFHQPESIAFPLEVSYRILSFNLSQEFAHKRMDLYDSTALFKAVDSSYSTSKSGEELFKTPSLRKSGSLSRGISVGNRQSVFLNSALNLQLEGELTEGLNIRASITDQNIPIQPEGNTQQLQDFDNVYLELYNKDFSILAGDVVLQQSGKQWQANTRANTNSLSNTQEGPYFLRYRRNVQGGQLNTKHQFTENIQSETSLGFAISKGKFASLTLSIEDGVQGPYQITSPEHQANVNVQYLNAYFIIANSEKVYLDGKLLERGYDKDYTINYNLSEITFTSRVLLTRYSRVYVDFEYADRSYSRSIISASHTQQFKHLKFYSHYYREKDNPNQALGFSLSDDDKFTLQEAGDQLRNAIVPAVDSAINFQQQPKYQANRSADVPGVGNLYQIFYNRRDTIVNAQTYEIYVFEGKEGDFKLDFSYVGEGEGNYIASGTAVNSKVYQWVAPLRGQPQGNYEPVRLLTTPQSQHMIVLGAEAELTSKDKFKVEGAFSKNDLNVLSPKDTYDDHGQALLTSFNIAERSLSGSAYQWGSAISYEYRQKYFREIDPYRSIEFERDWTLKAFGLGDTTRQYDDHLLSAELYLKKDAYNQINYQWVGRNKSEAIKGIQQHAELDKRLGKFQLSSQLFLLSSQYYGYKAYWRRISVDFSRRGKYVRPGYIYRIDKNQQSIQNSDSVTFSSMNYEEHMFYLRSADSLNGTFQLDYSLREDFLPYQGQMLLRDNAQTLRGTAELTVLKNQHLGLQLTYRQAQSKNDSLFLSENAIESQANTLMGQLSWKGSLLKGAINSDLFYSLANGREPKREFVYVQVPVGEGSYTWRDDNGNGVEELDEFYEARYFDERNYIRVFVPTTDYQLAFTNNFNYQLKIQGPSSWNKQQGIRSLLNRFSNITSWQIDKRVSDQNLAQRTIPWLISSEENLLSITENLRSTLFFNRKQTTYGADLGIRNRRRKQLLNGGFEERIKEAYVLEAHWNLNRHWRVQWEAEQGEEIQRLEVNSQSGRNFHIQYYSLWPELAWQPTMNTRIATRYTFLQKQNIQHKSENDASELSDQHIVGLDVRLSKLMSYNINATLEYVTIDYQGQLNTPIAYEMLDGLQSGANIRWTLNWQQQLLEGLQLLMNYYGRKSQEKQTVHSGSLMLRALF
ncbi:hypothetical protein PZB74_16870 [Porifericola rhodea]|uniref:hypothetical protein n=1 Tax=Porifericola rhodea TaxID=930972 RepID=UPI002666C2D0|nr:hypothetical protein [Porifericola rhodea]WKN30632.1 hypothetical protein PZB74_16870 [Porifericola rhodea]